MTAECTGGTSAPKAGYAAVVDFGVGQLVNLLAARNLRWLIPAVPLAPIPNLTLSSFCASDPPANPTFTTAETLAILGLQFGSDFDSGISKLTDLLLRTVWREVCTCTSGTLIGAPTVTIPTGTPIIQEPSPAINSPCASVGPQTVTSFVSPSTGILQTLPYTYVIMGVTNTVTAGAGTNANCDVAMFYNDPATPGPDILTSATTFNCPAGQYTERIIAVPVGTNFIRPAFNTLTGSGTSTYSYLLRAFCGTGAPNAPAQPCCPPDEATQATLALILQMVTLQQRQTAPFAYVYGTNHTGLTGDGELAVSGLLGVSIDVTTTPDRISMRPGTPPSIWDVGEVTLGTTDGWTVSRRIDHDGALILPAAAGIYTRVGYTLTPGVTVAIRELVREP